MEFKKPITFFVGENGSGKSTLLESIAIVYGFNPEGGSKNFIFSSKRIHSNLYKNITMSKSPLKARDGYFLRAEAFYNLATNIDKMDEIVCDQPPIKLAYGGKSLHNQSHGEGFISLVMKRFKGNALYLLDESESALSPLAQLSVLVRINQLVKPNSQFIIATHSSILMIIPNSEIYEFSNSSVTLVAYNQTEHYNLTKYFLNNTQDMLNELLQ